MSFSSRERAALKIALLEAGPDQPTCCEGWATHDLAVHLYVRENKPLAAAGVFVPQLAGRLTSATNSALDAPYEEIVQRWGSGPPLLWRPIDAVVNCAEHFVHHEDVRRAPGRGFEPRDFSKESQRELYRALGVARKMLSHSTARILLRPDGDVAFDVLEAGDSASTKTLVVSGPVSEILLWTFGRPAQGLDFFGDQAAVRRASL